MKDVDQKPGTASSCHGHAVMSWLLECSVRIDAGTNRLR